jgi:hypothetical protein
MVQYETQPRERLRCILFYFSLRRAQSAQDPQADDGAECRNQQAVDVESGYSDATEEIKEKASDKSADYSNYNISENTLRFISPHDERCDPAGYAAEDKECNDAHMYIYIGRPDDLAGPNAIIVRRNDGS